LRRVFALRCIALALTLTQQIALRTVYSFDMRGMGAAQSALTFHSTHFQERTVHAASGCHESAYCIAPRIARGIGVIADPSRSLSTNPGKETRRGFCFGNSIPISPAASR
jgi:hypothetical protein